MTKQILSTFLLVTMATICRADGAGPSFDCRRAQTPDEIAICSDVRLRRTYGEDFEEDLDILDCGYWLKNGYYEPPQAEWRVFRDNHRSRNRIS